MKSLIQKIKKNKKKLVLLGIVMAVAVLLIPHSAFAQGTAPGSNEGLQDLYGKIINFLIYLMEVLQRLIWPVILLVGGLLKNDILFSAGMEETMLAIWGNIRNLVNILFVLVLLGIAFYNVMGGSSQDYHLKTILPKFIIGLIAVNFSFVAGKVVLDGVNVVTTAIFALPGAVERDLTEDKIKSMATGVCEGVYGKDAEYEKSLGDALLAEQEGGSPALCTSKKEFTEKGRDFFARFDSANAAIVMSVNLQKLNMLDVVKANKDASFKDLAINTMFSTILYVIYGVSFVALLIILLARMVVIWIGMVLSPLVALAMVLPESLRGSIGGGGDMKTQFIQNIIVPIPIALVMSIGFIMLQALQDAKMDNLSLGTSSLGVGLLTSGLNTLQDLIVAVGVIAFIWMGVFAAAEKSAAKGIVGSIKGATEGFGKFLAMAPFKYAPIIPVGEGKEKVSLGAAMGAIERFPQSFDDKMRQQQEKILGKYGGGGGSAEDVLKQLAQAKGGKETATAAANQGQVYRGFEGDTGKRFQQKYEEALRNIRGAVEEGHVRIDEIKGGGKTYNWQQFKEALRKGEVPQEAMEDYVAKLRSQKQIIPKLPTQETKPPVTAREEGGGAGTGKESGEPRQQKPAEKAAAEAAAKKAAEAAGAAAKKAAPAAEEAARKAIAAKKDEGDVELVAKGIVRNAVEAAAPGMGEEEVEKIAKEAAAAAVDAAKTAPPATGTIAVPEVVLGGSPAAGTPPPAAGAPPPAAP